MRVLTKTVGSLSGKDATHCISGTCIHVHVHMYVIYNCYVHTDVIDIS